MQKTYVWKSPLPETPDDSVWKEVSEWSRRLAKLVAKGRYQEQDWQDELSSAAAIRVWRVWQRYRLLPIDQWKKVMNTVMVFAMRRVIRQEELRTSRLRGPTTDWVACNCAPKHHCVDDDQLDPCGSDFMDRVETRVSLEAVYAAAPKVLSPSELRVMTEVMRFEGLSGAEMAERQKLTPNSFGAHKSNAISKLGDHFQEP